MLLAMALTVETRVSVVLVDTLSVQIREPRLDASGWDEDRDSFIPLASFATCSGAGILKLFYSVSNLSPVGIDDRNQCQLNLVLPSAVLHKLLRESLPDELLSRPTTFRADLDPLHSEASARSLQESPREYLVLPVFT
jgi:hypothetical protein